MCPEELILLVSSIAIAIAKEQPAEILPVYAAVFTMLGDAITTYITQSEYLQDLCESKT